jgi:tRNA threonylcarbamoyladenosine biosynthesis protein TsaB
MITLALDASTYTGTVAVWRDHQLVAEATTPMRDATHERLMPAVAAALGQARAQPRELSRVVCGGGPGSFTSLRIAGAIAKGIAMADGAELWSVSSLGLIVTGAKPPHAAGRYVAVLDALRGELYASAFDVASDGTVHEIAQPRIVPASSLDGFAAEFGATVLGPGRSIAHEPHARGAMALLGCGVARQVNLNEWEPEYGRLAEAQVRWEAAHGRPLPNA